MNGSSATGLNVDREQVVAYRLHAHGLHRAGTDPADLAVLQLGVQDNRGSAQQAIGARLATPVPGAELFSDDRLTQLWSFRGAPHMHRSADLAALSTALWPRSDADAFSRLAAERKPLRAAGIEALQAFRTGATALHELVHKPMVKGEVSARLTAALPASYSYWCRSCASTHVYGGLFQQLGIFAGIYNMPGSAPLTLAPLTDRPPVPTATAHTEAIVRAYLTVHGPATAAEVAGYLGTNQTAIKQAWPGDLAEVNLQGRRTWLPTERLADLNNPPEPPIAVLLPSMDPYLQARDRDLIAPDEDQRSALWRILGNPGALLVDGEVAGVWRMKASGHNRLELTVQLLRDLPSQARDAIQNEAARIAVSRQIAEARVRYE